MPRRRIGDGPSARLLGDILLTVIRDADRPLRESKEPGTTAADLERRLGLPAAQVRSVSGELVRARCLRVARAHTARLKDNGRYAQAFCLAPRSAEHGPARGPRLFPVALIVEPDCELTEHLGASLREAGMIPVAVAGFEDAFELLQCLGFELVTAHCPSEESSQWSVRAARLRDAARRAGCGPTVAVHAADAAASLASVFSAQLALPQPVDRASLRSVLHDILATSAASAT
jgi:hypothetical protein